MLMKNLEAYRASQDEKDRTNDLLRILPRNRRSVLDIGARDGHFSRLLKDYFPEVTALDLEKPQFEIAGVQTVAGDVCNLHFASNSFDCVFCAEVLEHIQDVQRACNEIVRVARREVIVGVPFKQDLRIDRCTCHRCGKTNPAWGHVQSFDSQRLRDLFSGLSVVSISFVGRTKERSNALSAWLMDVAGNPWGTYDQEEPCIYCGEEMIRQKTRSLWKRGLSAAAAHINQAQSFCSVPRGKWIHIVFSKETGQSL